MIFHIHRCSWIFNFHTSYYFGILIIRTLFGIKRGTPFLKRIMAVSGWPLRAAMCINVLPSLVRSKTDALNLSAKNSTIEVCPLSAARCMGVRSMKLMCNRIQRSYITIIGLHYYISMYWDLYIVNRGAFKRNINVNIFF